MKRALIYITVVISLALVGSFIVTALIPSYAGVISIFWGAIVGSIGMTHYLNT